MTGILTAEQYEELDEAQRSDYVALTAIDSDDVEGYVPKWVADLDGTRREKAKTTLDKLREENKTLKAHTRDDPEKDQLRGQVQDYRKKDAVNDAIEAAGGIPELLRPHLLLQAGIDADGNVVVMRDGKPRTTEDGDPMTLAQLAESMKTDDRYKAMFRALSRAPGGKPPARTRTPSKPKRLADMSRQDKVDFLQDCYTQGMSETEARHALLKLR